MIAHDPRTARTVRRVSVCVMLAATLLSAAAGAPAARAAQTVRPYEVTVTDLQAPAAFDAALRRALVRATGRRDASDDPAFAALLSEPRRFVLLYRPVAEGLRVSLDGAALDRAILAAGGTLWPRERAVVALGVSLPVAEALTDGLRREIDAAAAARGLPVSLLTAPVPADLDAEAALKLARARGADALLLGTPDAAAVSGGGNAAPWQWRWIARGGSREFAAAPSEAVDVAADALARDAIEFMQQPEEQVIVAVTGVRSLADHALAVRLLGAVPGVRSVTTREVVAATAVFSVAARGGPTGLVDALAAHAQLRAVPEASEQLTYDLQRN